MSECHAHHPHHGVPPSAAGHLDPYGARVTLRPVSAVLQPQPFLVALLEDVAAGCIAAGASVIGHLKCVLHLPGEAVVCNLTSIKTGAKCRTQRDEAPPALEPGQAARLDLTVLVYGASAEVIDGLVRTVLDLSAESLGFQHE